MRFAVRWLVFLLACSAVMWAAMALIPPARGQEERCFPEIMMVSVIKSQAPVDVTDEISSEQASRAVSFIGAHVSASHPEIAADTILVMTGDDFPAVILLGFLNGCYQWRLVILPPAYEELRRAAEGSPA